jgi:NOL1/NOP2/fmu family ribosome biogenesis protein
MRRVDELVRRFGIPDKVFSGLEVMEEQETVFVGTPDVMEFDAVRPMRRGLRMCRVFPHSVKPTTWAMQVLAKDATRNCIDLTKEQASAIINGGELDIESGASDGFVLLRWNGFVVGIGLYKRPRLKSQVPRYRPVD